MSGFIRIITVFLSALLFCGIAAAQSTPSAKTGMLSIKIVPTKGGPGLAYFNVEVTSRKAGLVYINFNAVKDYGTQVPAKHVNWSACDDDHLKAGLVYKCWVNIQPGRKVIWKAVYVIPEGGLGVRAQVWMTGSTKLAKQTQVDDRHDFK